MCYRNLPSLALITATFLCLAIVGCDDDTGESNPDVTVDATGGDATGSDIGADVGPDGQGEVDPLQRTLPQPGVEPGGHADVDAPLEAGQARAGKISGPETGFTGVWAHCRPGDFKLYNAEIMVCVQAETTNRFEFYSGGMLVDARRVDDTSEDAIGMIMPLIGLGTTLAQKVEVVRDGSEGGAAVIRVSATDAGIAHIYGLLGQQINNSLKIEVTTEYRLSPDSDVVEIVTWYNNPGDGLRTFDAGDWIGYSDRTIPFVPGQQGNTRAGEFPWLAALADGHSFGWVLGAADKATDMGLTILDIPWAGTVARQMRLDAGKEQVFRRWFVVGDGTLAHIKERAAELRGEALSGARRTVHIQTEAAEPVAGHWVKISRAEKAAAWGVTDENGDVVVLLEDGDYNMEIQGFAAGESIERALTVAGADATVTLETPAVLNIHVTEGGSGDPITSRIVIQGGSGWSGVALHGDLSLKLPPGTYTVTASHGPEYDAESTSVELNTDETTRLDLAVSRAFATEGWISADFHQHMEPSIDSLVRVDDRLLENASVGVELVVPTDHEVITDLRPVIEKYGLSDVIASYPGAEVSPIETHIGMYPMVQDKMKRGNGSIQLAVKDEDGNERKRLIPEVVAIARELPNDPVLQLNHARNSSSGMFTTVNFDPEVGPQAIDDDRFTIDFDALEVINRYHDTCKLVADWSGLLNAGVRITGLGNSDTHDLSGETGLPRNFLRIEKSVRDIEPDDIRQAIRAGRVTVGSHAFIDFSDGKFPGDLLTAAAGDTIDFGVRVQTPAWAQADKLIAVVNGEVVGVVDRPADATGHLDFDQPISITVDQDSWVLFFTYGARPAAPLGSDKPVIAFTNPIFIDTDGDTDGDGNSFEAPGVRPLSLGAVNALCN